MPETKTLTIEATAEGAYVRLVVKQDGSLRSDMRVPRWPGGELAFPVVAQHLADMVQLLDQEKEGPFLVRIDPGQDGKWDASIWQERERYHNSGFGLESREEAKEWAIYAIARILRKGQCGDFPWKPEELKAEFEERDPHASQTK